MDWGRPRLVSLNIWIYHLALEFIAEVEDMMLDAQVVGNSPGIIDV